jgi:ATP/maltotriose-dependent transcriptional regulator MalT
VRSAVYQAASGPERRAAHRALAHALSAEDFPDRHAWHLASGTLGPDEHTAAALESSAARACDRGGYVAAAGAFERAARLSPDGEQRARRLLEAATGLEVGGRAGSTGPLLNEALRSAHDPVLRAGIHYVRGRVLVFTGNMNAAQRLLAEEARAIQHQDPELATSMLCTAAMSCFMSGNINLAVEMTREAHALGRRAAGVAEMMSSLVLGEALLLRGDRDDAQALLEQASPILQSQRLDWLLAGIMTTAQSWIWTEQYAKARELLENSIAQARTQCAMAALPFVQSCLSELDFRTGRWNAAYAGATEAIELAEQTGQDSILGFSLVCLARVEAAWGLEEDCRAHVDRALALVKRLNTNSLRVYAGSVLGLLELGLGQPEAAVAELEKARGVATAEGLGEPAAVQWCPDLIEAYIRAGEPDQARELLGAFEGQALRTRGHWAAATASRCRGMLADDSHFEAEFHHAVTLHQLLPTPFELARTQLCIGERRRRVGRRTAARDALRCAADTFDALYARPWAQRARHEHNATGETPRRRNSTQDERLTAQELRVALVVANGATTRETASQLFLSPKTIEFHLGNIYRKLDVRSRTELARHPIWAESP